MSFVVRLDFLVRLDLIFSSSTFIGSLCDMIFLSFNNGLNTSSINILKARRVCGYFFSVNILGTLTHTFSRIFFILMELNHKNTDAFNLWLLANFLLYHKILATVQYNCWSYKTFIRVQNTFFLVRS